MQDDGIGLFSHADWFVTKNTRTQPSKPMLMFTQNFDAKEEDEQKVLIPIEEGGANLSQKLDNLNPLKVDKKKLGMSQGEVIRRRLLVVKLKF
jgi:hypothetical protein